LAADKNMARKIFLFVLLMASALCGSCSRPKQRVVIFHGAALAPVIEKIRLLAEKNGFEITAEASGSQVACRKITELGRVCDILILADASMVAELCADICKWRIDFATDEIVLGVGSRAPWITDAENYWYETVFRPETRLARVNETLSPMGYRTIFVLQLAEKLYKKNNLTADFLRKCDVVVDDTLKLPPLLKSGEIDYAFLFRSTAWTHEIRHIPLDKRINLGDEKCSYSDAEVILETKTASGTKNVKVRGELVTWTLAIPESEMSDKNISFVNFFLSHIGGILEEHALKPLSVPRFYGPRETHDKIFDKTAYVGDL